MIFKIKPIYPHTVTQVIASGEDIDEVCQMIAGSFRKKCCHGQMCKLELYKCTYQLNADAFEREVEWEEYGNTKRFVLIDMQERDLLGLP